MLPTLTEAELQISIQLKSETIMDLAGKLNDAVSNNFIWNYDGISPHIVQITSEDISNGDYYKTQFIDVNVEFNEPITNLQITDFSITNGELSLLDGSGKSYSMRIKPLEKGFV